MLSNQLRLGSLFDGSGGFPLAAEMCGITPVWASEIEKFPIAVTSKRFPNMKHLGDVTKINGADIESVDIITFGSPCQDLSVAGKRAGLDGKRSGLFAEAIRIIKEMREKTNGIYPTFAVWENVPGAFSSHGGEDFRTVLEELAKVSDKTATIPRPEKGKWNTDGCVMGNGYSLAWRVLDAQYWGVPQRRKRIFLVADFRNERAAEILFKRKGLSRDFAESRKAWERLAAPAGASAEISDNLDRQGNVGGFKGQNSITAAGVSYCDNLSPAIECSQQNDVLCYAIGNGQVDQTGLHTVPGALNCMHDQQCVCYDARGNGEGYITPTITGDHENRVTDYTSLVVYGFKGMMGAKAANIGYMENCSPTIQNTQATHCLVPTVYSLDRASFNQGVNAKYDFSIETDKAQTLVSKGPSAVADVKHWIVRRLTPLECCRLQGFPDWWCADIPHADSPEYRMYGNGVALPCVLYVMEGLKQCYLGEK